MAGAIAELGVPQQGAVAALPVPGTPISPQQADTDSFRATAGPMRRGFRSGMNSVGAMLENLAGQAGETLGLEEFAASRFQSAAEYTDMANSVAPAIRDTSQINDLNDLADYVSGHMGSGAATTLPVVAAGVGLRRPIAGVLGGSTALEAGEQVGTLRADPTVMATQTPGAILANSLGKGVIAGGMETALGAGGMAARTLMKGTTAGLGKNVAKGIAGEAVTEGAQDLTGQVFHQGLNPDKEIDPRQTLQAAAAGAAGGGGIALASQLPGAAFAAAKTGKELTERLRGPTPPRDPYGVPENVDNIQDPEELVSALEEQEQNGFEDLDTELKNNPEKYGKYANWREDADVENEFIDTVMEDYAENVTRPKTDRGIDDANKLLDDYSKKKYTRVETQGPETTLNRMGADVLAGKPIHYKGKDPKVADFLVQNKYKEESPGVWTPLKKFSKMRSEADDNFHDFMMERIKDKTKERANPKAMLRLSGLLKDLAMEPRAMETSELPAGLRNIIGDRFDEIMEEAIDKFHSSDDTKQEARQILSDVSQRTKGAVAGRMNAVKALIRTNLRPEYSANKELREAALGTLAGRMVNYVETRGTSKDTTDAAFIEDAKHAFGVEKATHVIEELDALIRKDTQGSYEQTGQERTIDDRIGVPMSDEKALSTFQALREEFGDKAANLVIVPLGKNRLGNEKYSIELEDPDTVSITEASFPSIQESSKYNKSELVDGILTVRTDKHPSGVKVNLVKLTNMMIRKEGQQTQEGGEKYIADMFARGISALVSMPGFRGFSQKFEEAVGGKPGEAAWTFPDNTLVAKTKNAEYRFKDIKKYKLTRMELAGITAEDIAREETRLRKTAAGKKAPAEAIRQIAIEEAKSKARERAMDATLFDNMDIDTEEPTATDTATLKDRDAPVDENKGRTVEEDTGLPVQGRDPVKGPAGPTQGQKGAPVREFVSETEYKKDTRKHKDKTVVPDDRIQKAYSGDKKLSTMNIGKGPMTAEQKKDVRDYIERVLGKDRVKVLFRKLKNHSGSFEFIDDVEQIKIAIDAIDPLSVGYHEAVHAFFARLVKADRKAANTLLRAASSPMIVARLRELLKDHPDALKQLSDPEERLAYMYQFWATKLLHFGVGPETGGLFGKIKAFFHKLSAIWSDEIVENMSVAEAGEILLAFHNGDFADRSTVAQVLHTKFPKSPLETAAQIAPWLTKVMNKFVWTAAGAVRDMNLPPLTKIVDQFHTVNGRELEDSGVGFLQAKPAEFHKRLNKVVMALEGLDEVGLKKVLDEMRSGQDRTSKAAQDLELILKEAFNYMTDAGVKVFAKNRDGTIKRRENGDPVYVDLREIKKNYFPRVPDVEYIRSNKDAFLELLRKHKIKDAEGVYQKYTTDLDAGDPKEEDFLIGLTYYTPQTNERSLGNIPDAELAPFLSKDLFGTMAQYLGRATRRAEYTRRFGNAGEAIRDAIEEAKTQGLTKQQELTFNESVRAMEGSLGGNMTNELRQIYGGLMTYQNIRLLPLALFSSLIDPMGIVVRGGTFREGGAAFLRGIREMVKVAKDENYDLAKTIGAIDAATASHFVSDMYGSQYMPKTQRWLNEKFFKYNGMEGWNRSMRIAASAAAERFIIRHATEPNEHSDRYMKELGLSKSDVQLVNDKLVLTPKIERALNLWVDQAIIRPNAANRPVYMSDPNWMLISHLKQYSYMFQKVIIARVHNEMLHGNLAPAMTALTYVPIMIASDMLRATLTPGSGDDDRIKNWTAADWLWRGVQRAGLFGPSQIILDAGTDLSMNKMGIESAAGPTVQQLMDFARGTATGNVGNQLLKAVPGARLFQ